MKAQTEALASWAFALGLLAALVLATVWSVMRLSHSMAELGGDAHGSAYRQPPLPGFEGGAD